MDAFPAFVPLKDRVVVIAGTGDQADAKVRLFAGSPAELVRLTDARAFLPASYRGAAAAFVASEDPLFRQAAANAARGAHVLVNVVDHPELSDFHTPALVDRGEVVAAIGTAGASPMLAALLRNDLEAHVPEGAGRVAALLRKHREAVREALPELHERRAFLRTALTGAAADTAMAGDMEGASRLFLDSLENRGKTSGRITFIQGRGPADLLTIRAVRALGAADELVADDDADPKILELARRDAIRRAAADTPADALIELSRQGRQVVRVITRAVGADELRRLIGAGIPVDVMLAAPSA